MKLFKATPVNSGYKTLQDDIKKTTNELQIVYNNLENVVELTVNFIREYEEL